jgi:hypothetical protein
MNFHRAAYKTAEKLPKEAGVKDLLRTLCLLSLVLVVGANGQTTNGNVQGTVVDPQGAIVAGAAVTARNMDTGLKLTATTSNAGVFALPNLPPGRYAITVEAEGMKKYTREGITVATNSTVGLEVQLQVGSTTESVTVTADAAQLETETSDIGATVQNSLVDNLPLEVSGTIRNPVQFITLVPGFVGNVGNDPGSNSTDDFKVSGGQMGGTDNGTKVYPRRGYKSSRCCRAISPPSSANRGTALSTWL